MSTVTSLLVRKSSKQSWSQAGKVQLTDSRESLEEKLDSLNEGSGFAKYKVGETVEVVKPEVEQDFMGYAGKPDDFAFSPEAEERLSKALDAVGGAPVELEDN